MLIRQGDGASQSERAFARSQQQGGRDHAGWSGSPDGRDAVRRRTVRGQKVRKPFLRYHFSVCTRVPIDADTAG
ncbi:MAG: hypothetical protein K2Q09_00935 [Phycisphaerales bacterium]|nr:hypothetical protein [Phycisphaerales bacterium]